MYEEERSWKEKLQAELQANNDWMDEVREGGGVYRYCVR